MSNIEESLQSLQSLQFDMDDSDQPDQRLIDEDVDSIIVIMNDDDVPDDCEYGCDCEKAEVEEEKPQIRDWKYWTIRGGFVTIAVVLGFMVSHYITALFFGGVAVKSGIGLVATKLGVGKAGIIHHLFASRAVTNPCCCCQCQGCNGCCPCAHICCSC